MFKRLSSCAYLLVAALLLAACWPAPDQEGISGIAGKAAVAMPDSHAAQVSEEILRAGGNAVDAAIAAGFALAVTYPEAGNIGGGGFMLMHVSGEDAFLDYRETAPLAAHRDMYLDDNGEVIEGASLIGIRATGVPGTVAGFWAAHQRYGTLPWKQLLQPAIDLAENGFIVLQDLANKQIDYLPNFEGLTNFQQYFGSLTEGTTFRQPELADTLRRIAESGAEDFYSGETARRIVSYMMESSSGLITAEDLLRYRAVWRAPVRANWRGYEVISAPPPSSGGFAVIQLLKIKEQLSPQFEGVSHNSPQYIHLIAEIEKRVFADRAEYFGDPDFVDVPIDRLLSNEYIARRAKQVDTENISRLDSVRPGLESNSTTHFSIVDRWGNAVSNTYTLNDWFGNGVVVEGAGFLLNGEMDDFSIKPGVPNLYGVIGDTANEIQPGKRMLSSMSPTILLKGGEVALVVGCQGGSTIFTSVFQTIVNAIEFDMPLEEAVSASRFHHQLHPADLVTFDPASPLPPATISALAERGYRVEPHFFKFGDVQVVTRDSSSIDAAPGPYHRGESRIVTH
jgi:gamma-glutamyltranspeptidase/glutathione hydrolase